MNRLRREARNRCDFAVAAEVLELRSLLSAGAAAVHHAVHAADHAAAPTPDTHPVLPTIAVTVQTNSAEDGFHQFPGTMTITPVVLKKGSHITIKVNATDDTHAGATLVYTAVIKGTVTSFEPVGISNQVKLVPAGSIVEKDLSGHTLGTAKVAKTPPLLLTLNASTGKFITFDVNFTVPHSKPPIAVDFQCAAVV
jgi:hypothetical protein